MDGLLGWKASSGDCLSGPVYMCLADSTWSHAGTSWSYQWYVLCCTNSSLSPSLALSSLCLSVCLSLSFCFSLYPLFLALASPLASLATLCRNYTSMVMGIYWRIPITTSLSGLLPLTLDTITSSLSHHMLLIYPCISDMVLYFLFWSYTRLKTLSLCRN